MSDSNKTLLDIRDLSVDYETDSGTVYAVRNLNLSLGYGESLGLVGETGAGKTTTALSIMQLITDPGKYKSGEIYFEGRDMMTLPEMEKRIIRGGEISMIFQDPMTSLNPVITVVRQIAEVISLHENITPDDARKKAIEMLEVVGIRPDRADDYPHQFSGGMCQRVVIAIALACNPQLLIADEPTTALDITIQAQVLELMKELKERLNTSLIMITHDLGIVAETCDRVAIMYAGNVVETADTESLFTRPMHPYTTGLFDSIPDLDSKEKRLKVIPGLMPDPTLLPVGCSFAPRCTFACESCERNKPTMVEVHPGHWVACPVVVEKGGVSR